MTPTADPQRWLAKPLPFAALLGSHGEILGRGDWNVLLYHHDCPDCRNALAWLLSPRSASEGIAGMPVAIVEIPPFDTAAGAMHPSAGDPPLHLRLEESMEFFIPTPTLLTVSQGAVTSVRTPAEQWWIE